MNIKIHNQRHRIRNQSWVLLDEAYSTKASIKNGIASIGIKEYEELPATAKNNELAVQIDAGQRKLYRFEAE